MNDNNVFEEEQESQDIAIIGMAAHFPGARNVAQFWDNLRDSVESIEVFSDEALAENHVSAANLKDPNYVKVGAPLPDMKMFDASFFGFSPKEAMILDPQHRHFLECSWEALEHAGYDPERYDGAIGVFGGSGHNAYLSYNLLSNPELHKSVGFFLLRHTGNDKDFLTTRVSYIFNLKGPSVAVQTACSTSLVAIHLACQSILNGECDMVLAGGATIELPYGQGYTYKEGEILSPDGHCRAFDEQSKGTVFGSGAGIVVLKKLDDAIADGDTVHAVIKASAINNDGSMKMGYLAPSVDGQAAAVEEAIEISGVEPETISYIETHGTGTPVGDPIEVSALTQAYRSYTEESQFCALGSVKTNIGHLDTAAGVAGVIKVVESLKHKQIPASLHFQKPNPAIDFANSPFYVNNTLSDWSTKNDNPRRAAVNSLGVGGTNAHLILEEAPERAVSSDSERLQLLFLSARTQKALDTATDNLSQHLKDNPDVNLADVAHTLRVGRKVFSHRRILVCSDSTDAIKAIDARDPKRLLSSTGSDSAPSIAFMFTGQGAQYAGMGRDLYQNEPVYKAQVDQCCEILKSELGLDLRDLLFPADGQLENANKRLQMTSITQPALFVTEYAIASLWDAWGIKANAMIGHSVGEYVAACLAGVFSLEEGLSLVAARGRLMESMPTGDMMAVSLPEAEMRSHLNDELSLAAINTDGFCVVSGNSESVETLKKKMESRDVSCRTLLTSHAFHSSMMDPMLAEFTQRVSRITLKAPEIPFVSNVSGTWITAEQATSADYWAKHLRGTVRFADGLQCLLEEPDRLLLEIGPGNTLSTFARQNSAKQAKQTVLNSMRHPKEDVSDAVHMLNAFGRLWMAGVEIDNKVLEGDEIRYRIPLPTYPFEKQQLWVQPGSGGHETDLVSVNDKQEIDEWFYQAGWRQTPSLLSARVDVDNEVASTSQIILFLNDDDFSNALLKSLQQRGLNVVVVKFAESYSKLSDGVYQLNFSQGKDYEKLFDEVAKLGTITHVVNLWNIASVEFDAAENLLDESFYYLFSLVQALGKLETEEGIRLTIVSEGMQQVAGELLSNPERAVIQGVCKVANSEFSALHCTSVDVQITGQSTFRYNELVENLVQEILQKGENDVVAYRGDHRFIPSFEKMVMPALDEAQSDKRKIRKGGVYLITGGLGGLGLSLAEHLIETANAKVVLVSRGSLPPKDEWNRWLSQHSLNNDTSNKIRALQRMDAMDVAPLLLSADVTNLEQMQAVISNVTEKLGQINGVFHTAGVLNDGLISLKDKPSLASVLAPKVQGTIVLDRALSNVALDFFVLYSSVSSVAGIAGQVDYTAANAFLNAFAQHSRDSKGTPMVAVNWGAWQQVGMAAKLASDMGLAEGDAETFEHPFFKSYASMASQVEEFRVELSAEKYWVLDQHRTKAGIPLVPGTGYLEFIRAAYDALGSGVPVEISNVLFISPFAVKADEKKLLCVKLEYDDRQADFTVLSRGGEGASSWTEEHVQGSVTCLAQNSPKEVVKIEQIIARCDKRHEVLKGTAEHAHLKFGGRWKNIDRIDFGDSEAIITMALPEEFHNDFEMFALHPAMLDLATGAAQSLIPGFQPERDFLVPISYSKIEIIAPLEPQIYSHVRYSADADNQDVAYFDVTITDRQGRVLMDIHRFMMKQVDHTALAGIDERPVNLVRGQRATADNSHSAFAASLATALLPHEGVEALERILSAKYLPQVIVSPVNFNAYITASQQASMGSELEEEGDSDLDSGVDRPDIPTAYVEPGSEIESAIAKVWQAALGINKIGIHDNFFELGGHSLLLTQIVARVRKQLKREVPLSDVFELPTIAEWAEILDGIEGDENSIVVPDVVPIDRAKYRMTRAELKKAVGY